MQAGKGYRKIIHLIWSDRLTGFFFYFAVFENKEYMFYTCILYSYFQLAKIALSP